MNRKGQKAAKKKQKQTRYPVDNSHKLLNKYEKQATIACLVNTKI
jgi:hypothetical protein